VLCVSLMYPARAVQTLWLLKGGNSVRVSTYSVFKKYQTLTVPVNSVTCLQTRADASAQIPMKISGKWFFYLLDKKGKFHNPELFDLVVSYRKKIDRKTHQPFSYRKISALIKEEHNLSISFNSVKRILEDVVRIKREERNRKRRKLVA